MCNACTAPCAICSLSPEARAALKAQLLKNVQDNLAGFPEAYLAEMDRKIAQLRARERLHHCPPEARTLAMYEAAGEEPDWAEWEEPPRRRRLSHPSTQLRFEFPEVAGATGAR